MKSLIRWDPFKAMRAWDPFDEMRTMQRDMDRLFDRFLGSERTGEVGRLGLWMPSIESYAKEGKLFIKVELPGVDPKDLDVSITDRELVIKGERKAEKDEKGGFRKSRKGMFARHPISGAIIAARCGLPDDIVNTIACHAKEGDGAPKVLETVLIHQADFATFDPLVMMEKGQLII